MKKVNILSTTTISILLLFSSQSFSQQKSLDRVWKLVNDKYYDISFNGVNWQQVHDRLPLPKSASQQENNSAIQSMIQQLNDPAVRLLAPEQVDPYLQEVSGKSHSGIGFAELLSIDTDSKTRKITVVTPIPETPAARAGIQPGDIITAVDKSSTTGMSLADTMMRLRGNPNTQVNLTILRSNRSINITVKRETIQQPTVRSSIEPVNSKKIGYIAFSQFTSTSASDIRLVVQDLSKQGVDAFVLDLRNNPGGDVSAGKNIAGIFLGNKPIATVFGRGGKITQMIAEGNKLTDKPLSVLVNRGTASMAEVLASGLEENQRAKIVGVTTFGKSLIQSLENLPDKSALTIPIGKIRTLKGREILNKGITPNVIVDLNLSPILNSHKIEPTSQQDLQFQKAIDSTTI